VSRAFLLACLVLGTAYPAVGQPAEKADEPARTPPSPWVYRRQVLVELRQFRKVEGPSLRDADEHIARAMSRRFHELQDEAVRALAYAGNEDALARLVREFDLENPDDAAWVKAHVERDALYRPSWSAEILAVVQALEPHRPELARKTRERFLLLWRLEPERKAAPSPDEALARLSLAELEEKARNDELAAEAMVRWARLDPERALPWLLERMNNQARDPDPRFRAARAAALVGDRKALAYLGDLCLANVGLGGSPGAALLEAGDPGVALFFRLVQEHEKQHPDKPLPYALADAPGCCPSAALFRVLPRLLDLNDEKAWYEVRATLDYRALPPRELAYLIERLRKGEYKDDRLADAVVNSLCGNPTADRDARQVADLWADELQRSAESRRWERGTRLFLRARLGTSEVAADGARRHLKESPREACQILAAVGRTEDVALIWEATHPAPAKPPADWYEAPSAGWLAILRLTNHLPAPAAPAPEKVARWIGELDSDRFEVREEAARQLDEVLEHAAPALRKALADSPSAERRRRIERLLDKAP
jgi:hypothetical protein